MNDDEQEFRQMHIAELIETIANLGGGDDWDGSFTDAGEVRFLLAERICKERVAVLEAKLAAITKEYQELLRAMKRRDPNLDPVWMEQFATQTLAAQQEQKD